MRPDIDPGVGELGILALVAIAVWFVWALVQIWSQP